MDQQSAPRPRSLRKAWPGQSPCPFTAEVPKPAEWDQLLTKLGLDDSQALSAIKSEGNVGKQLRDFVLRFFRQCFVPEAVIRAVRRSRNGNEFAVLSASEPTEIDSNSLAMASGEHM